MSQIDMSYISETVDAKRAERGISYSELARRINWNVKSLNNALHGRQGIKADRFVLLCNELGLEVIDFIGRK